MAAPEKNQSYAGVAQQHLSDLVLNKYVVVRYSSLRDGYVVGQVLSGDMDVGAQMIRDGAAWYDKLDEKRLSETEQRIYAESQAAARSERRGRWQDESPISPWDFRQAQPATTYTSTVSPAQQLSAVSRANPAGLSSEDLMGGMIESGSFWGKPDIRPLSREGVAGRWLTYRPADRHFSVLAPSDGIEMSQQVLAPQGKTVDKHDILGSSDSTIYIFDLG